MRLNIFFGQYYVVLTLNTVFYHQHFSGSVIIAQSLSLHLLEHLPISKRNEAPDYFLTTPSAPGHWKVWRHSAALTPDHLLSWSHRECRA